MSEPKITTEKIGGIWHGYLEGDRSVDERGLTEEIARRKVQSIIDRRRDERTMKPNDRQERRR